jgi:hypothetical protein
VDIHFRFNNSTSRGFWWGHSGHTTAQGAMSLSTDGNLYVANNIALGFGESYTTDASSWRGRLDARAVTVGGAAADNTVAATFSTVAGSNESKLEFSFVRRAAGSDWTTVGTRIQSKVDSTWQSYIEFNGDNTNNHGLTFGSGTGVNANSVPERMRIDQTGRVGIATTSPTANLHVVGPVIFESGAAQDVLRINRTGTGNALVIEDQTSPDISPFIIDDAGVVIVGANTSQSGIGVSTPATATLQVHGYSTLAGKSKIAATHWGQAVTQTPALELMKAGVGSTGTGDHVIVVNNETLGAVRWGGSNGNVFITAASIECEVDGTPSDNTMPARLVFNTNRSDDAVTEKMRITATGNVGIGLTAPTARLHVSGNAIITSTTTQDALRITHRIW